MPIGTSVTLSEEAKATLDAICAAEDRSRSWVLQELVLRVAASIGSSPSRGDLEQALAKLSNAGASA